MSEQQPAFRQSLGLFDATMIVAGSMIGSGIFIVSADITRNVGSAGWLVLVWVITGFMTITAAVSYGELSGMFPKAGGQYIYLKEAYNPFTGFLYGWSFFAVIQTATIAAVGVAFSKFTAYMIPEVGEGNIIADLGFVRISAAQLLAIALIILLTFTNTRGIREGKIIQTTFTTAKLLALLGLIVFGFLLAKESFWAENWTTGIDAKRATDQGWEPIAGITLAGAIAVAMVGSIFSSDAWNNVTFIAGEIRNPRRNIGLALFLGTLIVTIIYICTNLMYLNVLPLQEIAHAKDDRVAVAASQKFLGEAGTLVIAGLIMVSTFGCNNGLILAGARVYYAMAKDSLFFRGAGRLNRNAVPGYALWLQCIVASLLCLSGSYGDLLTMISFVVVLFYILTIVGIFILRRKRPDIERPYKAFGYPVLPIVYVILALGFCAGLLRYAAKYSLWGLAIVLAGIPLYFLAVARNKAAVESGSDINT
ncbi:MAG TPA: amino acid permease [Chitinophagaceae bacterium]|nr:amino acid permease [Chitinophagaceae bacterium]